MNQGLQVPPGPNPHPGFRTTRWYGLGRGVTATGTQALDTLYAYFVNLPRKMTIAALGARCDTGVASSAMKVGLYSNVDGLPGAKLTEVASPISGVTGSTNVSQALAANYPLIGGAWAVAICSHATQFRAWSAASNMPANSEFIGGTTIASALNLTGLSASGSYATGLPASLVGTSWSDVTTAVPPVIFAQEA